jgi:hypothetical protein
MFAIVSRDGMNSQLPLYPARDIRVFCIYSTDGEGVWSGSNGSEEESQKMLSVLGEDVESAASLHTSVRLLGKAQTQIRID